MRSLMSPPVFADEERTRIARLLHVVLLAAMAASLFFLLPFMILVPENAGRYFLLAAGIVATGVILFVVMRRGFPNLAGGALVLALWGMITAAAATGGGARTPTVSVYVAIVFMAGLLLGSRAGAAVAGLCASTGLGMVLLDLHGGLPPPAAAYSPVAHWLINSVVLSVVVVLQHLAAVAVREALARARSEIAERKHTELALRESEEKYRAIASQAGEAIFLFDGETLHILEANDGFQRLLGYAADEVEGLTLYDIVAEEPQSIERNVRRALAEKRISIGERPYRRRDGSVVTVDVNAHFISYGGRDVICAVVRDVTDRKQAEQALRLSQELYRRAIEAADAVPYYHDYPADAYTFMGAGIRQMTGYSAAEMTPQLWQSLVQETRILGEGANLPAGEALRRARTGEIGVWKCDYRIATRSGHARWVSDSSVRAVDERGNSLGAIGILQDVTARKLVEAALAEQAAEITTLYRASAQLLAPAGNVNELAQRIADTVVQEFRIVECGIWLVAEEGLVLRRAAYSGRNKANGFFDEISLHGPGLTVTAVKSRQTVYAPDVSLDPRYLEIDPWTRSELAIPLRTREQVIGVINIESIELNAFDQRDRRILTAFSEQAALALENTRLVVSLEQAVQRANELAVAAEEASRIKSQFLTNTSHELRTPLTSVIGSLDIVLNNLCSTQEEERQMLQIAAEAAHGLSMIVDDLLEIAKIEAGGVEVRLQVAAFGPFLTEVRHLVRPLVEAKNLQFEIDAPDLSALVYADTDKLRRILANIVGNAIKFTRQGRVTIVARVDREARRMVVDVQDTGVGIPTQTQSKLFRPFVQADGSATRRYGGTGLGLTISQRLAEMMGGALTLYSAGEGQGTTLTLTLPLADVNSSA